LKNCFASRSSCKSRGYAPLATLAKIALQAEVLVNQEVRLRLQWFAKSADYKNFFRLQRFVVREDFKGFFI
jgi:hypothetical protein